jgi:DNA-binding transcriptional regulator YdaS (Cro superfamily)
MELLKKKDGIAIAGSAAKLARCLGVSRAAITQWGEWMPPYRVLQLRDKMPERFAQHCVTDKKQI